MTGISRMPTAFTCTSAARKRHLRYQTKICSNQQGSGRIETASEYAWYAVAIGVPLGLATTGIMHALGPSLYAHMGVSGHALTIAVSTIISAFNSLTLSPALCALMLKPRQKGTYAAMPRLANETGLGEVIAGCSFAAPLDGEMGGFRRS